MTKFHQHDLQPNAPSTQVKSRQELVEKILGDLRGKNVFLLGIGGGGDIISTLPTCLDLERLGAKVYLGGLTWKRSAHDPEARPRQIAEFKDIQPVNELVGLCNSKTQLAGGIRHVEAQLSHILGNREIVTLDISPGSARVALCINDFMNRFGITSIIGVDAGGDALCFGSEPTIRSPICDQTVMAALSLIEGSRLAIHSFGTDGELPFANFKPRFENLVTQNLYHGALDIALEDHTRLQEIITQAMTESSRFSVGVSIELAEAARLQLRHELNGPKPSVDGLAASFSQFPLRGKSRVGELGPLSAFTLYFDLAGVFSSSIFATWWKHELDVNQLHRECTERGLVTEFSDGVLPVP